MMIPSSLLETVLWILIVIPIMSSSFLSSGLFGFAVTWFLILNLLATPILIFKNRKLSKNQMNNKPIEKRHK